MPFEVIRKPWILRVWKWNSDIVRGGSSTTATAKIGVFVSKVNGFQLLTIVKKASILDFAAVLDVI